MTSPNIVTDVATKTGKQLNLTNILVTVIVTIIVSLIVAKALKQTVVITDNDGRKIAEGDIKTSLKIGVKTA